jgi:hypothetical protein
MLRTSPHNAADEYLKTKSATPSNTPFASPMRANAKINSLIVNASRRLMQPSLLTKATHNNELFQSEQSLDAIRPKVHRSGSPTARLIARKNPWLILENFGGEFKCCR